MPIEDIFVWEDEGRINRVAVSKGTDPDNPDDWWYLVSAKHGPSTNVVRLDDATFRALSRALVSQMWVDGAGSEIVSESAKHRYQWLDENDGSGWGPVVS